MNPRYSLTILLTRQQIEARVAELAAQITADYQGRRPLLVGVLKGAFIFMADLIRRLELPLEVDFVRLSSYGSGKLSSGKVRVMNCPRALVKGRDVLVVEDIVDTGLTTAHLLGYLRRKKPASLRLCVLTDKRSRRQVPVAIDYLGFVVPNEFLVGYGLDLDESFRYLPDIYICRDKD